MIHLIPFVRLNRYLFLSNIILLVLLAFLLLFYQQYSFPYEYNHSNPFKNTRYERYCRQVDEHINAEQVSNIPIQLDPGQEIPYSYSQWRSTSFMPRLLTPCEHAIYMDLLSILVEHVFKKYNIQYMMMATTLLGSYTHHDVLPWDGDVDIYVSISNRYYLKSIILRELSDKPYSVIIMQMRNKRNYDKVFFSWCSHTSNKRWRFPSIDIFYHNQNSTHVWLLGKSSSCPVRHEHVYPLVLRPLGPLWLYGPREPMAHFESQKMTQIETGCYAFPYAHKYEKLMRPNVHFANCSQLKSVYPYVERRCTLDECKEVLKLGDKTIIHTLIYNYSYRTFLYTERNRSYKAC